MKLLHTTLSRRVVLGDGALWIWKGNEVGEQWAKRRRDELDRGEIDIILEVLQVHATRNDEARKCLGYLANNRDRMRYPTFRAEGLVSRPGWWKPVAR